MDNLLSIITFTPAVAALILVAYAQARSTLYNGTNKRVAMRIGAALTVGLHRGTALLSLLILPLALTVGPSTFATEAITQHLLTNAWAVNLFFPGCVRVQRGGTAPTPCRMTP